MIITKFKNKAKEKQKKTEIFTNTIDFRHIMRYYIINGEDMDENLIKRINLLTNVELSNYSSKNKVLYYKDLLKRLDKLLNDKNINLDDFEQLLEIKKHIMSKINTEKGKME